MKLIVTDEKMEIMNVLIELYDRGTKSPKG